MLPAAASPPAADPPTADAPATVGAPILRPLGRVEYAATVAAMRAFTLARGPLTPDELWIVEHPPVYTLGQAGRREHLLAPGDIPVAASDRGGQVTYHGPGQAVVYTLIDLRRAGVFVKELVYRLEAATLQTLDALGIAGRRVPGAPGVYVPWAAAHRGPFAGLAKIAALGVKVTRGASYHGVALNVAMDLAPFARIDPCGYAGLATVDLATLGVVIDPAAAGALLAQRIARHFPPPSFP